MTDLIARIDALIAPACGHCGHALPADGPSGDFCGEMCASSWRARQAEPLIAADPAPHGYATGGPISTGPIMVSEQACALVRDLAGMHWPPRPANEPLWGRLT